MYKIHFYTHTKLVFTLPFSFRRCAATHHQRRKWAIERVRKRQITKTANWIFVPGSFVHFFPTFFFSSDPPKKQQIQKYLFNVASLFTLVLNNWFCLLADTFSLTHFFFYPSQQQFIKCIKLFNEIVNMLSVVWLDRVSFNCWYTYKQINETQ